MTPVASSSNISRPQDITIRDNFDLSLDLNIGDDLIWLFKGNASYTPEKAAKFMSKVWSFAEF